MALLPTKHQISTHAPPVEPAAAPAPCSAGRGVMGVDISREKLPILHKHTHDKLCTATHTDTNETGHKALPNPTT
jgi:hypothetical protein